jgi:hypothetical protein
MGRIKIHGDSELYGYCAHCNSEEGKKEWEQVESLTGELLSYEWVTSSGLLSYQTTVGEKGMEVAREIRKSYIEPNYRCARCNLLLMRCLIMLMHTMAKVGVKLK